MNPILETRVATVGRLGSFWTDTMAKGPQQDLARSLSRLFECNSAAPDMELAAERMTGKTDNTYQYRSFRFDPRHVVALGGDMSARVLTEWQDAAGQSYRIYRRPTDYFANESKWSTMTTESAPPSELLAEIGEFILIPVASSDPGAIPMDVLRTQFLVPIPFGVDPVVIMTADGPWVQGIDFSCADGVIITIHDPAAAFPEHRVICQTLRRQSSTWSDHTLRVDGLLTSGRWVAEYYRERQTPLAFERAIAEAGGILVMPWGATLLEVQVIGRRTYYRFEDKGLLLADYPHTPMAIGEYYPEGTVIGGIVKVHAKTPQGSGDWHRKLDWSAGLPLDGLTPFEGLIAPDEPRNVISKGAYINGKLKVEIDLLGPDDVQADYWAYVRANEQSTRTYINDAVGYSGTGAYSINPFNLYWDWLLRDRAMVIETKSLTMGAFWDERIRSFVDREKPCGSLVILRDVPLFS